MRIGLFGGTFDPIHFGHLRAAVELGERYALDTVRLVPNHRPAHRPTPSASTEQRLAMLELAIGHDKQLSIDAREAKRDSASYSYDTLAQIKAEVPTATLVFFMGVDAFNGFRTWHRWQDILTLANLVVIDRPDANLAPVAKEIIARQHQASGVSIETGSTGVIERFEPTRLAISATDLRARVSAGLSIRYLVPAAVADYVATHRLYQTPSARPAKRSAEC